MPLRTLVTTILALLAFAANSLLARAALGGGHADPWSYSALRLLTGALLLLALSAAASGPRPPLRRELRAGMALLVYTVAFAAAYLTLDAATGALILFASVQFGMLLGGLLRGHRPSRGELAGMALGGLGLAVLLGPGVHRPPWGGAALMALAGAAWAAYSLHPARGGGALRATAWHFTLATAPALFLPLLLPGTLHLDGAGLLLAGTSGALASGLGYALWHLALRALTPVQAAVSQLAVPPLAAVLAFPLLGERPGPRLALAGLLVLGGTALALRRRGAAAAPLPPSPTRLLRPQGRAPRPPAA